MSQNRSTSAKRRLSNEGFPLRETKSEERKRLASSEATEQDDYSTIHGTRPIPIIGPSRSLRARRSLDEHPKHGRPAEKLGRMYGPRDIFDVRIQPPKSDYHLPDPFVESRQRAPVPNVPGRDNESRMLLGVGGLFAGSAASRKGSLKSRATTMESSLSPRGSAHCTSSLLDPSDNARGQRSSKEELEDWLAKARTDTARAKAIDDTKKPAETQYYKIENIPLRTLSSAGNTRQQSSREDENKTDSRDQTGSNRPSGDQDQGQGNSQGDRANRGGNQDNPPPPPPGGSGSDPPDDKNKDKPDPSKDKGKAKESDGESQENSTKDKGKGKLTDKDEVRAVHDSAARKSTVPPSPLELPPPVVTPPGQEITADHETASVHKAASEHETASEHEITADKKTTSEHEITAGKKITPGDEITPDKKTTSGEENTSGDGHPPPRRWRGIWSDLRHGEGTTRQRFTRAYRDAKAKLGSKGGRKKQQPPGG